MYTLNRLPRKLISSRLINRITGKMLPRHNSIIGRKGNEKAKCTDSPEIK